MSTIFDWIVYGVIAFFVLGFLSVIIDKIQD